MRIVTDAFLQSCAFQDGDVVKRINGVAADTPDRVLGIADQSGRDRRAVVIVARGADVLEVVIEEG